MVYSIIKFFNSSFFLAFITFCVGGFAIFLYIKQKRDYKSDATNIILMEIRDAEIEVRQMKTSGVQISNTIKKLLPTNNWSKYNYLFIKDLDRDELDLVNTFYNQCSAIDSALSQASMSRQIENKGNNIQDMLVQIAKDSISSADYELKKKNFLEIIEREAYVFKPNAPLNTIAQGLNGMALITTSTAGDKLKKIAKME